MKESSILFNPDKLCGRFFQRFSDAPNMSLSRTMQKSEGAMGDIKDFFF